MHIMSQNLTFKLQVMLEVANLYLTTDDLDACQHQLMTLLKNEKENDAATIVGLLVKLGNIEMLFSCLVVHPVCQRWYIVIRECPFVHLE